MSEYSATAGSVGLDAAKETSPGLSSSAEVANLDILRALAVLLVFVSHIPNWRASGYALGFNMGLVGSFGVSIFFVHTALVLQSSLLRLGRATHRGSTYRTFLLRRVFRVYPLSIVAVVLVAALARMGAWPELSTFALASNLLLVQNLFGTASAPEPLWSLPFEMQMYLVLPLLFDVVHKRGPRAPRFLLGMWAILAVALIVLVTTGQHLAFSFFQRAKYGAHFLPGVLAYALLWKTARARVLSPWVIPILVCVAALVVPWFVGIAEPMATVAQWCLCLSVGAIIPYSLDSRVAALNMIANRIAKYSYGIYLVHHPIMMLVYRDDSIVGPDLRLAVVVAATIALSVLSYHLLEEPFIRFGKRMTLLERSGPAPGQ